jgi:threonyl-tRNA synthetase
MIIIGEKEVETGTVSVRTRDSKTVTMTAEEFVEKITSEIRERA